MLRNILGTSCVILIASFLLPAFVACDPHSARPATGSDPSALRSDAAAATAGGLGDAYPVVEGLHVTGTPVEIDLASYRLEVVGAVDRPLSLSYEQVLALPRQRSLERLVCPGFFTDEGHWTGTPLKSLLERAGVREGARSVEFVAADGGYRSSLKLEDALSSGVLIAYEFDDRPFPMVHGYPLRLVAPGQAGSVWVKWLGRIVVE